MKKKLPVIVFFVLFVFLASGTRAQNTFPSSGSVGIGTTSPGYTLDVLGNEHVSGIKVYNGFNYANGGSGGWAHLGVLNLPQLGNDAYIKIYGGQGYDADVTENGYIDLHIRTSNGAAKDANGFGFSASATSFGRRRFIWAIKIVPSTAGASATVFNIYINIGPFIGNGFYSVESASGSWSPSTTTGLVSDPGAAAYNVPYEFLVNNNTFIQGSLAINTTDPKGYSLAVNGPVVATQVVVKTNSNWPDYVFSAKYHLPQLAWVKDYTAKNKHLPDMPSFKEVREKGTDLGSMEEKLLKKIEELTLYVIKENEVNRRQNLLMRQLSFKLRTQDQTIKSLTKRK